MDSTGFVELNQEFVELKRQFSLSGNPAERVVILEEMRDILNQMDALFKATRD